MLINLCTFIFGKKSLAKIPGQDNGDFVAAAAAVYYIFQDRFQAWVGSYMSKASD